MPKSIHPLPLALVGSAYWFGRYFWLHALLCLGALPLLDLKFFTGHGGFAQGHLRLLDGGVLAIAAGRTTLMGFPYLEVLHHNLLKSYKPSHMQFPRVVDMTRIAHCAFPPGVFYVAHPGKRAHYAMEMDRGVKWP